MYFNVSEFLTSLRFHKLIIFIRNVLFSVYIGSQLSKLPRLSLAILLAPLGDRILQYTAKRLKISADEAMGVLTSLLVSLCVGIWAVIIISDATFSKTSLGTFAM